MSGLGFFVLGTRSAISESEKGHFHFVGLSIDHLKYSNGKKAQGSGPKIPEIENTESLDRNPETE